EVDLEPVDGKLHAFDPLGEGRRVDDTSRDGIALLGLQARVRGRQDRQRVVHRAAEGRIVDRAAASARAVTFAQVRLTHVAGLREAPAQVFEQAHIKTDLPAVDRTGGVVVGTAEAQVGGDALAAVEGPYRDVQLAVPLAHGVGTGTDR